MNPARTTNRLQRAWDRYDAYLFDIDGTLLNCTDAVHYWAFCDALSTLAGAPLNLDGVVAHGNTDVGILRDALRLANVPEEQWRPRLPAARAQMIRFVTERAGDMCVTILPAVMAVLNHLKSRRALLGVATGNLEQIGKLKLSRCGLLSFFDFAGYSDLHEYRCDVFREAIGKVFSLAGAEAKACVFGDTPEDIQAAHANGLDVIALSTGIYTYEQLQAKGPERCLHSLAELTPS